MTLERKERSQLLIEIEFLLKLGRWPEQSDGVGEGSEEDDTFKVNGP